MVQLDMDTQRAVMIVAGEASGDLHGASLVREMKALDPSLTFCGVGGKGLEAEGVRLVAHSSDMAVVGLTEVFSKLRHILGVFFRLRRMLRENRPQLLILIDYPDFNLPLAAAAKRAGVKVFYYISPPGVGMEKEPDPSHPPRSGPDGRDPSIREGRLCRNGL